jgi:hypothetical protein
VPRKRKADRNAAPATPSRGHDRITAKITDSALARNKHTARRLAQIEIFSAKIAPGGKTCTQGRTTALAEKRRFG